MTENPQVLMSKVQVHMEGTRAYVSLDKIVPHPLFHVRDPSTAKISELAENIRTVGRVINAVQCRGKYLHGNLKILELLSGWRRYQAVKQLGWPEIPVDLIDVDDHTAMLMIISENFSRKDLSPIEEARQFQAAKNSGLTENEIASALKPVRSVAYVSNRLRLLKLEPMVQELIHQGKISAGHAEHGLLRLLEYPGGQVELAERIVKRDLPVSELDFEAKRILEDEREKAEIEKRLETAKFKKCPTCGKPPISLYSPRWSDDLEKKPFLQCEGYHHWHPMEGIEKRETSPSSESAQDRVNRVLRWPLSLKNLNEKLSEYALDRAVEQKATVRLEGKFDKKLINTLRETGAVVNIALEDMELTIEDKSTTMAMWSRQRWSAGSISFTIEPHAYDSGEKSCIHINNFSYKQRDIDRDKAKVKKLLQSIGADA